MKYLKDKTMLKITIMVGCSGSGKSTYVQNNIPKPHVYLNADTIRKELYGDENIQGDGARVFGILYGRLSDHIASSVDYSNPEKETHIVIDNTSITYKSRKEIYKRLPKDAEIHIVYFALPLHLCLERNSNRSRQVPEDVIRRQHGNMEMISSEEGKKLSSIIYINIE